MQTPTVRFETRTSPPITIPAGELIVHSRLVQLKFPSGNGGLIWNRPAAVVVHTWNGQEETIPILDVTRIAVLTMAGICLTSLFALLFLRRKRASLERRLTDG